MLSNAGGVSTGGAETTPTRGKAAVSLNSHPLASSLFNKGRLFCKWSQPSIMHLRYEGIAS